MRKPDKLPHAITRRTFLKIGGMSATLMVAGRRLMPFSVRADASGVRRLVVIEMNGGNDGLNTVIPYGDSSYYDVRRPLAIPPAQVLKIDNMWGLHNSLQNLSKRYTQGHVAIVRGVGYTDPDLSHFRMSDLWRAGNPDGAAAAGNTGWVGRMLQYLTLSASPMAAMSLYPTVGPMLVGPLGKAVSAQSSSDGNLNYPDGLAGTIQAAISGFAQPNGADSPELAAARQGMSDSVVLSSFLTQLPNPSAGYPKSNTANLLGFAATVLAANDWIRIIHLPLPLDHDTHADQLARQQTNLAELDGALEPFVKDLQQKNLLDQTLIMTVSEFGRRVQLNGSGGTDHGTASSHFFIGSSVNGGLYGDPPSLTKLDPDGNLVNSSSFLDLEATACAWMGVDPNNVLPSGTPYAGLLTA